MPTRPLRPRALRAALGLASFLCAGLCAGALACAGAPQSPAEGDPESTVGDALALHVFLTTDCPIANGYAPALVALFEDYREEVALRLWHVDPDVTPATALEHARTYGLEALPIGFDREHELVSRFGIRVTPEVALVDGDGRLLYRGRIDDGYAALGQKRPQPTRHDLRLAVDAALAGEPIQLARTDAVGCYVADLLAPAR